MAIETCLGALCWALIGVLIGARDGRAMNGLLLGLLLGPVGILILVFGWVNALKTVLVIALLVLVARHFLTTSSTDREAGNRRKADSTPVEKAADTETISALVIATPGPKYICWIDGKDVGPLSVEQIRAMERQGTVNAQTPMVRDGAMQWGTVGDLPASR